jgi:Na+-transporting methylmalonyl-CoA/oxaloacetate decarboxylase gamma subunit
MNWIQSALCTLNPYMKRSIKMSVLTASLIITAIGMGLVFVGVLLLWALMEGIVRLTAGTDKEEGEKEESEEVKTPGLDVRKQRVAAVAVAFALSVKQRVVRQAEPTEGNALSAWQMVRYASRLSRRASLFNRMK